MKNLLKGALFACLLVTTAHGYCKYRYFDYDYKLTDEGRSDLVARITNGSAPFSPHKADYAFVDKKGVFYSCVLLNRADRRHLRKQLVGFNPAMIITNEMIDSFFTGSRRMKSKIVGWVLRDFKTANDQATVGHVLNVLHLQSDILSQDTKQQDA